MLRLLVWLSRFRHRRGYGVHSPFAYGFITDVVYNRGEYYAYAELREQRKAKAQRDIENPSLREKDDRLLFRLINFAAPRTALIYGPDARHSLPYLQAGRRHCQFFTDETCSPTSAIKVSEEEIKVPSQAIEAFSSEKPLDFFYTTATPQWPDLFARAIALASPTACFVVHGIHHSRRDLQSWRTLTVDPRVRVTFDLYDFGIAFFHPRLQKQDYTVCYY